MPQSIVQTWKNKPFFECKVTRAIITMARVNDVWKSGRIEIVSVYGIGKLGIDADFEVISSKINS